MEIRGDMSRKNRENTYSPEEKAAIANEFSPALAEVLETVSPAWPNKVVVESNYEQSASPTLLRKLRQLGDKGLQAAMNHLNSES